MSQENVEIVQRAYAAFAAGGVEALVASFAADVLMHPFPEWVEQSVYRGHDGVRQIMAVWIENFDEFTLEVGEVRDVGDSVLMLGETAGANQRVWSADPAAARDGLFGLPGRKDR